MKSFLETLASTISNPSTSLEVLASNSQTNDDKMNGTLVPGGGLEGFNEVDLFVFIGTFESRFCDFSIFSIISMASASATRSSTSRPADG